MTPRISVIMPVRNGRPFLAEAISSILQQTCGDFEFIVVDDGSTDGSPQVVEVFAQNDARLKLVKQSRGGVTAALRHGVQWARAELIARMDADDVAVPERFAAQIELLDREPQVVAVGSYLERIDADGESIAVSKWPLTHDEIDAALLCGHGGLAHPSAMIRHDALDAVGGYRQEYEYSQDKDLWLRLAEYGRLANLPWPLLRYREHLKSISMDRQQQQWESMRAAVSDACRRRKIPLPDQMKNGRSRPRSEYDLRRDWVRAAARAGNLNTAWKHARHLIRERPFATATWTAVARITTSPITSTARHSLLSRRP